MEDPTNPTTRPVEEKERVWHAGKLEPLPLAKLPDAPQSVHIIGPAMILVSLSVGLGETYMWPRLVLVFGPDIRWLFLIGVTLQTVVVLEMSRYAMATGESIFMGAARVFKPIMWFFFGLALITYIWPGHISAGALAFQQGTGILWLWFACIGLLVIGVIYSFAKYVYNLLEKLMSVIIGVMVIGSAIVAGMVGNLGDLEKTMTGLVAFGYIPDDMLTAAWFPIIVGSIAFAGPSGMQQMWYTLYLRDKGAGMGAHLPKIRGLTHVGEEETYPSRGYMVDTDDPGEMRKWKSWRRWVHYDGIVLFFGITMLVTIIYTVLAQKAARISPNVQQQFQADNQEAAISAMAGAFSQASGDILGYSFLGFIAIVGFKASLGLFDAFSRGQADIAYYFIPGAQKLKMSHLYFAFLWGVIIFGVLILLFGPADGPTAILDILAFLSAFAMGAYCIVLLLVNNRLLPKKLRPGILSNVLIGLAAVFYLGALFISLAVFGAIPE